MTRPSAHGPGLPARALLLGLAGDLRSWPPLGILALNYDTPSVEGSWKRWWGFDNVWGRRVLVALGIAEFVADKVAADPAQDRAQRAAVPGSTGGIFGRVAADTLAGAALAGAALGTTRP